MTATPPPPARDTRDIALDDAAMQLAAAIEAAREAWATDGDSALRHRSRDARVEVSQVYGVLFRTGGAVIRWEAARHRFAARLGNVILDAIANLRGPERLAADAAAFQMLRAIVKDGAS